VDLLGGAERICFVISQGKSDILEYYGGSAYSAYVCYAVQPRPVGLCDAIFQALPVINPDEPVLIGLPDTIWFPKTALQTLPDDSLSFLLFPVTNPERFDAVVMNSQGRVVEIQVKQDKPDSDWVWGAFKMPGTLLHELYDLWRQRERSDEYIGSLVNAWLDRGGEAYGIRAGRSYFDVGTMDGYMETMRVLGQDDHEAA
jgi:glucose-1-phosphate thymidylyltransferase